ncbi:MAG TPA: DMT family transporter [Chryseosolibacter sp.]|nr:DMT family transporter [Chryseosolibacter sp.]
MTNRTPDEKLFLAGMILSMTCWGFSWTAGKIIGAYGDAITISFLRFALTFISLLAMVVVIKDKISIKKSGIADVLIATALLSFYTYLFFLGLQKGKAGAGGVLVTVLNPIIAYAIMLVLAKRKPTLNEAAGLTLGLVAGAILLKVVSDPTQIFTSGNIYFLIAAFAWAVLSRFTARATRYGSSVAFSFWIYGLSTLLFLVIAGKEPAMTIVRTADFKFWANLFFSATITTSLATTFYFIATSRIGASRASSFIFMVPFSAALGSWLFLGEKIETHTIVGGILGIAAVYILNRK